MKKRVVCGGTFDHFHQGHKAFLQFACDQGDEVVIGITSDILARKKTHDIEPYEIRKKAVGEFLQESGMDKQCIIVPIDTAFIPEPWNSQPIDLIITTESTRLGAEAINKARAAEKLPEIPILVSPFVLAEDGKPISSSRIRNGEINRTGKVFIRNEWTEQTLYLPSELRKALQQPFDQFIRAEDVGLLTVTEPLITVGDVVTAFFLQKHIIPRVSAVDFQVQRKKTFTTLGQIGFSGDETIYTVDNPAGQITGKAFEICRNILQNQANQVAKIMRVVGEEDLIVIPLILAAPLGYVLFYGQPNEGMVRVLITEEMKEKAYRITTRFLTRP
jgi:pantetheine-phosphate adenylyltransferase